MTSDNWTRISTFLYHYCTNITLTWMYFWTPTSDFFRASKLEEYSIFFFTFAVSGHHDIKKSFCFFDACVQMYRPITRLVVMVRWVQGEADWAQWCTINSLELHCINYLHLYLNINRDQGYAFGFHSLPWSLHRNAMKHIYTGHLLFQSKLPNLWKIFSIMKT